ncbi:MAG: T9SS type A sorting domain-containing protein [Ignavibacteria bacterium]
MKKIIYTLGFVIILNTTFLIQNCQSQWVLCNNGIPNPTYIRAFALFGGEMYMADGDTLYKTSNNGNLWTKTSLNKAVHSLAVSNTNIFAGTWADQGVWVSSNNGTNWTQTALNTGYVSSLFVVGSNIYAGTGSGLYISSNNGISWTQTFQSSVHLFATIGETLLGQYGSGGLYTSTNQGYNWSLLGLGGKSIQSFSMSGNTMYAGTNFNGLWISTNSGTTWIQSPFFGTNSTIYSVITSGNQVIATLDNPANVFYSNDQGQSWTSINEGIGTHLIVILYSANGYVFAGTGGYGTWRRQMSQFISIHNISTDIPSGYSLSQNYPNPFNPSTKIRFDIQKSEVGSQNSVVTLKIYDAMGREVQTLINERLQPGTYETTFDGSNYSSGVYFYKLQTKNFAETKRMLLLK